MWQRQRHRHRAGGTRRGRYIAAGLAVLVVAGARKADFTPDIKLEPGVSLAPRYLDEVKKLWQDQWPAAWATFAAPSDLNDTGWGVHHVLITNGGDPPTGPATYKMKANDIVAQVDGTGFWDLGLHMHEGAHSIVNPFKFRYDGGRHGLHQPVHRPW